VRRQGAKRPTRSVHALVCAVVVAGASMAACRASATDSPAEPSPPNIDVDAASEAREGEGDAADGSVADAPATDASSYRDDAGIWHLPDPDKTPGALCTATDPNFAALRYAERIPICNRNVPIAERDAIGASYGIAQADFANYEFDHYIPLSIGGSDAPENLWPQPHSEALRKDTVEQQVFDGMNNGTMTQAQAIALIRAWRP
jgi:hypothetical protein